MTATFATTNPFAAPAADVPASEKQLLFICTLLVERDWQSMENPKYVARCSELVGLIPAYLDNADSRECPMNRAGASTLIEGLKSLPKPERSAEITDGIYRVGQQLIKVQVAVHGSGRPYGKVLDRESGTWDYNPAAMSMVRSGGTKLTLAEAAEFGHLYGRCIQCGRTLTDENSIAAGIGPICAGKF